MGSVGADKLRLSASVAWHCLDLQLSDYPIIPRHRTRIRAVLCGVWFGTTAGAYRYDGRAFTNFTRKL
ncbi:MAG: hypothetical protein H6832_02780 [Planctomycetes bacterium]|nr:hypothetical protein [Planctomycetota bacterium]MCB9917306.1 hypothetical protein [Planctomycetota bacterium]